MTSLSAEQSVVLGSQTPRLCHVPDHVSSAGEEAIECAARAGLRLDPWEQLVLVGGLGERADGKWAAFEVGLEAPRQNGKGSVLEARELAGLFVFGERLIVHSAHEQATSSEHFRRLLELMENAPEFDGRILKAVRGKGSEAIELRGGYRIFFKTRTGGGGRGLTGDLVVLDEAMILPVATTAALVPTMAARSIIGNPQLWYAGSAVDQEKHEHGVVFTRVRQRALAGATRLAYFGWSADAQAWLEARGLRFDPERAEIDQVTRAMREDPEMWAQANPGLGIRISLEHISDECGGALGPREFAVERLGVTDPPDTSEEGGRAIGREAWASCIEADGRRRIAGRKVFAIDASPDHIWGTVAVAGARADGLFHVAIVARQRGTDWMVGFCKELRQQHPGARFVADPGGPAANLIPALKRAGVPVLETSTRDYADACADFLDAIPDGLRHPAVTDLDDAVAAARKQAMGDRWKWSRKDSTAADISPLVSATLAYWGASRRAGASEVIVLSDVLEEGGGLADFLAPDVELGPVLSAGPQDLLIDALDPEAVAEAVRGVGELLADPSAPDGLLDIEGYYVLRVSTGSPLTVAQQVRAHARVLGALANPLKEGS